MPPSIRTTAFAAIMMVLSACASQPDHGNAPVRTVETLDVPRYMGTWYEVSKYPNRFQAKCVSDTRADYSLQSDGTVQVVNRCRRDTGEMDEAIGTARQVGPAQLEVRFAPWWLGWLPAVWGKYWVIDLDPSYQLVAVSEPKREYLWVLARTAKVDPAAYQALLGRLQTQGFDISKLEVTKH